MKQAHEDLQRRIAALRTRFSDVGARAAAASRALTATAPPPESLLTELTAVNAEFAVLRAAVLEHAASLPRPPAASSVMRLRDLESVTTAIIAAEGERGRRAAWDTACENAAGVLNRVRALIHREDKEFAGLVECQTKARELQTLLSGPPPGELAEPTAALENRLRPFVALVTLVDGWDRLDDERCASLQDVVAQAFGRPLGLAALRGKLGHEGEAPPRTRPAPPAQRDEPTVGLFSAATAAEPIAPPPHPRSSLLHLRLRLHHRRLRHRPPRRRSWIPRAARRSSASCRRSGRPTTRGCSPRPRFRSRSRSG